jgi:hypothetical protein
MLKVATEWLRSGKAATLHGIELTPMPHPASARSPLVIIRAQSASYFLKDAEDRSWILKKFVHGRSPEPSYIRAIRSLVPHEKGFESGVQRRVLTWQNVGRGFGGWELAEWIENTILMPRLSGLEWLHLVDSLREGTTSIGEETRTAVCKSLVQRVRTLEHAGVSHRDLSTTHVFIEPATWEVHFIDWDALYHDSLCMPANLHAGTSGYIATFVQDDARSTWCAQADRFAIAILCTELLLLRRGSQIFNEGSMFEQRDLSARSGDTVEAAKAKLTGRYPRVGRLLTRAMRARSFGECPSPEEWLATPPLCQAINAPALRDQMAFMGEFDRYVQQLQKGKARARRSLANSSAVRGKALVRQRSAPLMPEKAK